MRFNGTLVTAATSLILAVSSVAIAAESTTANQDVQAIKAPLIAEDRTANNVFRGYIEPHWLAFSEIRGGFQFRLGRNFSLGPVIAAMNDGDGIHAGGYVSKSKSILVEDYTNRQTIGLKGILYFKDVNKSSPWVSMETAYSNVDARIEVNRFFEEDGTYEASYNETTADLTAGYQWFLGSLITLHAGAGVRYYADTPKKVVLRSSNGGTIERRFDADEFGLSIDAGVGMSF